MLSETRRRLVTQRQYGGSRRGAEHQPRKNNWSLFVQKSGLSSAVAPPCLAPPWVLAKGVHKEPYLQARGGGANPEVTGSCYGPEQRTHWGIQSPQGDVFR